MTVQHAVRPERGPGNLVFWPPAGSALIAAGAAQHAAGDDFNGNPRGSAAIETGAYERTTGANPGWTPQSGFKAPLLVFADGFESGSTSAWSASAP